MDQEEYLTIDEAAQKLKISKVTIYRMAQKGKLPAVKFGKSWRISSKKLSELFEK
jgi:excisionase family DNA binding protein